MTKAAFALVALAAAISSTTSVKAASDLSVLPLGRYGCWTAGVASGPATIDTPPTFVIVRGSSYQSASGGGTYLLASDLLTFTRGPLKDMRLRQAEDGLWQQVAPDGEPGRLKCSRQGLGALSGESPDKSAS